MRRSRRSATDARISASHTTCTGASSVTLYAMAVCGVPGAEPGLRGYGDERSETESTRRYCDADKASARLQKDA